MRLVRMQWMLEDLASLAHYNLDAPPVVTQTNPVGHITSWVDGPVLC